MTCSLDLSGDFIHESVDGNATRVTINVLVPLVAEVASGVTRAADFGTLTFCWYRR